MFLSKTAQEPNSTKHQEYSLLLATILIGSLPFFYPFFSNHLIGLWGISILGFLVIGWSIFSVYRHGDVLAHRLAYSWLIHGGIGGLLFVGLVELFVTASPYGDFLLGETSFSTLMLFIGGSGGIISFVTPRKKTKAEKGSFILPYLGFLFVLYLLVFILPGSFVEVGLSKLQLVIIIFFCLCSYGWLVAIHSPEAERVVLFPSEDESSKIFAVESESPFSSYWHSGWLVIHLVAVFSVAWVLLPYTKKTILSEAYSPQWIGMILGILLVAPISKGMIGYAREGNFAEAIRLGILLEISRVCLGVSALIGFAIWLNQGIVLAFNLPQAILIGSSFIVLGLFTVRGEDEKYLKILGFCYFGLLVGYLLLFC